MSAQTGAYRQAAKQVKVKCARQEKRGRSRTKGDFIMVKTALYVRLEAKPGKEKDVENFLLWGLPIVEDEPATIAWFAIRMSPSTFGIFDAFPDEAGRQAHLSGRVAQALGAKASELLAQPPKIE